MIRDGFTQGSRVQERGFVAAPRELSIPRQFREKNASEAVFDSTIGMRVMEASPLRWSRRDGRRIAQGEFAPGTMPHPPLRQIFLQRGFEGRSGDDPRLNQEAEGTNRRERAPGPKATAGGASRIYHYPSALSHILR